MDMCIKVVVTCVILGTASARSYHGHYNHGSDKPHEHEPCNHDDGQWHQWDYHHHAHSEDSGHQTQKFGYPMKDSGSKKETQQGYHYDPKDWSGQSTEDYDYPPEHFGHPMKQGHHQGHQYPSHNWNNGPSEGFGQIPGFNQKHWGGNGQNWYYDEQQGRWVFPDQLDRYTSTETWVNTPPPPTARPATLVNPTMANPTPVNPAGPSTPSPLAILLCMNSCTVTSEYNPVCGSNNVTYNNPGRLDCARNCGVDVTVQRSSPCTVRAPPAAPVTNKPPAATQATATPAPANPVTNTESPIKPTRFTTIDVNPLSGANPASEAPQNGFTIPADVLASVFTNPATDEDGDDISETDIRTRDD